MLGYALFKINNLMKITFIGTGYVGLVSGVMMAHLGHDVTCLDIALEKIKQLNKLQSPIFEDDLEYYIKKYGSTERLNFKYGYDQELKHADVIFITVGTPEEKTGEANLQYVFDAALNAAKYANQDCILVVKSTVPPGTCQKIRELLLNNGFDLEIVSNPEFLREGSAVYDFLNPDRIIVGTQSDKALNIMKQVYLPLTNQDISLVETDLITSELIKYASNSFLATKIAFINEMSDLCEAVGADINSLSFGMGLDKRIGSAFLKAGPGFGGSCFPKDILALQHLTKKIKTDFLILDSVIKANTNRPKLILDKIIKFLGPKVKGQKIGILGLTYKAGTDDLRNSPAIPLINLLRAQGNEITAYDPQGMANARKYFGDKIKYANNELEAANGANAIIILTEWQEFTQLDYAQIKKKMADPVIIDLRNILDRKMILELGYRCYSIGKSFN